MLTIFTGWYSDKLGAGDQTCCCKPILAVCNKCQFYVKRRTNGIWRCMKMGKKIKKKKTTKQDLYTAASIATLI